MASLPPRALARPKHPAARVALPLLTAALALALCLTAPPAHGDPLGNPTIAAVGDMACDPQNPAFHAGDGGLRACAEKRVSAAVMADPTVDAGLLGLGDYQYDCDDPADFAASYDPTWGQLDPELDATVAGNHEYKAGNDVYGTPCPATNTTAAGYFERFSMTNDETLGPVSHPDTAGHFSFDLGSWHLIGLNGNCVASGVGGCSKKSPQTAWLSADLAATTQPCVLAFWHQPLWKGIGTGKNAKYKPWWDVLYAAHADVVLAGHIHDYQRFAPLSPAGVPDPLGITEYVVGTGGEQLVLVKSTAVPQPVVWFKSFGYLRMTLLPDGWTADFVDDTGTVLDTSTGTCH